MLCVAIDDRGYRYPDVPDFLDYSNALDHPDVPAHSNVPELPDVRHTGSPIDVPGDCRSTHGGRRYSSDRIRALDSARSRLGPSDVFAGSLLLRRVYRDICGRKLAGDWLVNPWKR